ncbi:MAG TPA: SGNH/GDSL hydrolase family protein [Pilimelia sp.]|nr:SGNH/GDSL hydrolase family protein [Pilimelia sp.]
MILRLPSVPRLARVSAGLAVLAALATWAPALATWAPGPAGSPPPAAGPPARIPATGPPVRIMPLGDSITWGAFSTTRDGYRGHLYERLRAAGFAVDFVGSARNGTGPDPDNEGHPGWRIDPVRRHVASWLAAAEPDVVLLQIGTNDANRNDHVATAHRRLSALIDDILAARRGIRVVVSQLPPAQNPAVDERIRAYNAHLPAVVAAKGPRVTLTSMYGMDRTTGFADPLHPNDAGYRYLAENWYRALTPVLKPPSGARLVP